MSLSGNCRLFSLCMNCIVRSAHVPPTMSAEPRPVRLDRVWSGLVRLRQVWLGMWLVTWAFNLKNANERYQICRVLKNFFSLFGRWAYLKKRPLYRKSGCTKLVQGTFWNFMTPISKIKFKVTHSCGFFPVFMVCLVNNITWYVQNSLKDSILSWICPERKSENLPKYGLFGLS